MFRLVGVGEQAGSGIPKIYGGWASQHWRAPALYERLEPYQQTLLELRMVDLVPKEVLTSLQRAFGPKFDGLEQYDRLVMAAAASEQVVTHGRVRELTGLHPFDATRLLQGLVQAGLLESHNPGRGAVYCLPGAAIPTPDEVFGPVRPVNSPGSSPNLPGSSVNLDPSSVNLDPSSPSSPEARDAEGCLLTDQLALPVIDDLSRLAPTLRTRLEALAAEPRAKRKVDREVLIQVVLTLCDRRFVTLRCLAALVNRQPDTLRSQYLTPLVKDRKLSLAFPTTPTHERQAYCSTSSLPQ
jgi:ATP-dependent DNA helicase RecG